MRRYVGNASDVVSDFLAFASVQIAAVCGMSQKSGFACASMSQASEHRHEAGAGTFSNEEHEFGFLPGLATGQSDR